MSTAVQYVACRRTVALDCTSGQSGIVGGEL